MQWPSEILSAFQRALEIEPAEGFTSEQVLEELLAETARRAVWRAEGDPARLGPSLRWPYTPLGSIVAECVHGRAKRLMLRGEHWGPAVQAFHAHLEANAATVCAAFQDEAEPYDDAV